MPLEMSPFGCWGLPTALLALFCCPGSGEGFEVRMYPEQLLVEPGGSKFINCSTSCAQPEAGGLETALTKSLLQSGPQWNQYVVSNISQDTVIYCYFTCSGRQKLKSLNVSVFYPPEQVLLKLQPAWVAAGGSFTAECHVPAVRPLESLTLTLLHGKEALCNKTFTGEKNGTRGATVTHNSTAHREDSRHNFSCHAHLDLRSRGGSILRSVSEPQMLKVYGLQRALDNKSSPPLTPAPSLGHQDPTALPSQTGVSGGGRGRALVPRPPDPPPAVASQPWMMLRGAFTPGQMSGQFKVSVW
ncbi:intercellular adhesion molecule 2 isoform X2 [Ailuropoda melanoleuca]|nr:intercellular adhesion molecule 2 isoform X2 [Ailuropoda melanoleuca]XP_034496687.1 intercellular adhesion molecule 2 isoform X2 [Ailuropoda melanoleuca]XP_034496688.1 intercellular adhesion molecule 2 isoform X2 [Ailuropoda melanoleuca]